MAAGAVAEHVRISVTGATTGVNLQTGAAPARININDLYQTGGPTWDLYVQALAELQAVDEKQELSYFKIMGIHGLPFLPYNGVGQVPGGADQAGFCPHNGLLFGLWHRPYLSLFEQVLVSHAIKISLRYDNDSAPGYRTTAETLRIAYWDWAETPALPEAVTLEMVTVNGPNGSITMENPFHSYSFQNFPFNTTSMKHGTLAMQKHTTRCPTADLAQNVTAVQVGLEAANLKAQVYEVFTTSEAFGEMETDYYSKASFESPHNNVHDAVGCLNGTMYDLNWSAFDPIFMLHHANVDRLIALWQVIYYNTSIYTIGDYEGALYGTAAGTVGGSTPLKPFYDTTGDFHTSNSVQDIAAFGYTYPELRPTSNGGQRMSNSPEDLSSYVKFKVNSLYTDTLSAYSNELPRNPSRKTVRGEEDGGGVSKTWSVAIQVDKAQVSLPATLNCYLGDRRIGKMALLGIPATGVTHSTLPLDGALELAGVHPGDENDVLDFLANGMSFDVRKGDKMSLDLASISSLNITVIDRDVTPRKSGYEFPTYGAATSHPWPFDGWKRVVPPK